MADIKLGKKIYEDVNSVKMDTADGGTVTFVDQTEVDEAYEAGREAEYNAFWDSYQERGNRTHYNTGFSGSGWNNNTYNPKYPLNKIYYAANMFTQSEISKNEVIVDFTELKSDLYNSFLASAIENITMTVPERISYTDVFRECKKLVNLNIKGTIGGTGFSLKDSNLLSKESIISVINALSLDKTSLTVTFSLTAVNTAFETTTGAADGSISEEWLTLANSKSNWNIALV